MLEMKQTSAFDRASTYAQDGSRQAALDLLMSRQSQWPLVEPAPSRTELDQVFEAAMRAPDHGQLQPWRFVLVRGDSRHALGEVFARAARERDPEGDVERFRAKATAAPVMIAIAAHLRSGHKVPEIEQMLAVGAATMNMLNALHILGYGGFWATGPNSRDANVKQALGLQPSDRLIGFLYVGTPKDKARPAARSSHRRFVREYQPAVGMAGRDKAGDENQR